MRENEFKINNATYAASEEKVLSTESSHADMVEGRTGPANGTAEFPKESRGTWTRRSVVSCLAGSLLLMLAMMVAPAKSSASVGIFVSFGPPAIPVYVQPACPGPNYIWTPGYWAWDPAYGYYWVPGTWVPAPFVGAMWTPGYWGWYNGGYMWYPGYWGIAVGFYGGINYGFGYTGHGYYGGYWRSGRFYYNRYFNRIDSRNIRTVYDRRVYVNESGPRISYNGGRGGIEARPTAEQLRAARTRRFGAINQQLTQERFARTNPAQRARQNRGRPDIAATARPGEFRGNGVVRATRAGAPYNEPSREMRGGRETSRPAPVERVSPRNTPRQEAPNRQMERRAPQQPRNERPVYRNNQQNNNRNTQREARPQPQSRRNEGRAAPERKAPHNEGRQERGNDRNPGHGRR